MVAVLKLVQTDDFIVAINTLDLLAFAAGFDLEDRGWTPKVAKGDGKDVGEVISLLVRGSTSDNLAAALHLLDEKKQQAGFYADGSERYGVFLRTKKDGETQERQAFVVDMLYELGESPYQTAAADGYYYQKLSLHITRKPDWEDTVHVVYGPCTAVNCVGGTFDYTTYGGSPGAVTGDNPARTALFSLAGESGGGGPLYKFWMGFRTERFGARANFQPYWSLRKSIVVDADTTYGTANADATAKDGYKTVTTFATVATLKRRATIRVTDVTANPNDQRGHFTMLLRAKLSASGVVRVRLADGLYNGVAGSMNGQVQGRVPISSTSWQFYELGAVQIPSPGKLVSGLPYLSAYALGIDAERVSGSCNLEMDCIVPVPDNEGFLYVKGGYVTYSGSGLLYVQCRPDGRKDSVAMYSGVPINVGEPIVNGGLPLGNGILVLAGQHETVSTLADTISVTMQIYKHWNALRGAE